MIEWGRSGRLELTAFRHCKSSPSATSPSKGGSDRKPIFSADRHGRFRSRGTAEFNAAFSANQRKRCTHDGVGKNMDFLGAFPVDAVVIASGQ